MKLIAALTMLASLAFAAQASAETLTQKELRRLFPGAYTVKFGRWDVNVHMTSSGVMSGRVGGFADRGRWSIEGNKLCVAWSSWNNGRKGCSALTRKGRTISGRGFYFNV